MRNPIAKNAYKFNRAIIMQPKKGTYSRKNVRVQLDD
jgi:hypothetical protein